jgi:hypothetical protein
MRVLDSTLGIRYPSFGGLALGAVCLFAGAAHAAPTMPAEEATAPPPRAIESASSFRGGSSQWAPQERDAAAETRARKRLQAWLLSVEGVTHAPLDLGFQAGLETPFGLRLFGGYGWVPAAYSGFLTGIAASSTGDAQAELLLRRASYQGHTWRIQAGIRPFRRLGLYGDAGYARLHVDGALDLSQSGVPALQGFGGGYEAHSDVDLWLFELGYQGEFENRLVWGVALGMVGTFDARTRIASVNGAPTSPVLDQVAASGDAALESYGFIPTVTLRLGFDLL